jgi:RimJ/RimL family protein N-acetyltransferase
LAGSIGLASADPEILTTDIGYVTIFPSFQRTRVTSNAVDILLRYCLKLPTAPLPGLGLHRVQWAAHTFKQASMYNAAVHMGFRYEGTLRWHWVIPEGKEDSGSSLRDGDPMECLARDNKALTFCADDRENGDGERVEMAINCQK